MQKALKSNKCNICPRQCNVDRTKLAGFCMQTDKLKISKVMLHHYEEPCISGAESDKGSGAIFFAGCNLKCVFCQNYEISHLNKGEYKTIADLVGIVKQLEQAGALNINLVTPTHFTEQIIKALKINNFIERVYCTIKIDSLDKITAGLAKLVDAQDLDSCG